MFGILQDKIDKLQKDVESLTIKEIDKINKAGGALIAIRGYRDSYYGFVDKIVADDLRNTVQFHFTAVVCNVPGHGEEGYKYVFEKDFDMIISISIKDSNTVEYITPKTFANIVAACLTENKIC